MPATGPMDLRRGLAELGFDASLASPLDAYLDELERWNAAYNLTAIRDRDDMVVRHVLDSLVVLSHVTGPVLDVGSGAGLPAIPLAVVRPDLRVTALDSNGKKARFLRHARRALKLENLDVAEARAEAFTPPRPFASIVSRAFASLDDFVRLTRPLLAEEGRWLAMKGKLDATELKALPPDVVVRETLALRVPGLNEERHLVVLALR